MGKLFVPWRVLSTLLLDSLLGLHSSSIVTLS